MNVSSFTVQLTVPQIAGSIVLAFTCVTAVLTVKFIGAWTVAKNAVPSW